MKILKKPDTDWSCKVTCHNCTAELQAEKSDLKYASYPGDCRDPGYETWTVNCPICYQSIAFKESTIPKAVQVEIKNKKSYGNPFER